MNEQQARESDEVAGHQWRLAQARRYQRFRSAGGRDEDIASICDEHGKIVPEAQDLHP